MVDRNRTVRTDTTVVVARIADTNPLHLDRGADFLLAPPSASDGVDAGWKKNSHIRYIVVEKS
jgi:hypothetical protein